MFKSNALPGDAWSQDFFFCVGSGCNFLRDTLEEENSKAVNPHLRCYQLSPHFKGRIIDVGKMI